MSPFKGGGLSSFDLRFSLRGGRNAGVGEDDGVLDELLLELLDEFVVAVVVVVVLVVFDDVPVVVAVRPPRPFAPPFRSLLWTWKIIFGRKIFVDFFGREKLM